MDYEKLIELGLNGEDELKLILCGEVEQDEKEKVGVVSVVFASNNKSLVKERLEELIKANKDKYYMVYSVPLDIDLTTLNHYPSIAIQKEDLI